MSDNKSTDTGTMEMAEANDGRIYWRSMEQLAQSPAFQEQLHREFPQNATELPADDVSRRGFLGVVAAAVAMAGATSCRKPGRKILPFARRPEDLVPGVPRYYATTFQSGGYGIGTVVRSSDGRPTKVEGNPLHPASKGGANLWMQGDLLNLYDPSRSRHPMKGGVDATWVADHSGGGGGHGEEHAQAPAFEDDWKPIARALKQKRGDGLAFLMGATSSPTMHGMVEEVMGAFPQAKFHVFDPDNNDNEIEGSKLAFGKALNAHFDLAKADVCVSFDRDFLGTDRNNVRYARDHASRRKPTGGAENLNRLYVVESGYSVTGGQADHRFPLRSHQVAEAVFGLAAELGAMTGDLGTAVAAYKQHGLEQKGKNWVAVIARDLLAARGRCAVMAGPGQPAAVHAAVAAINAVLGNVGKTVTYTEPAPLMAQNQLGSLGELCKSIDGGKVNTLFVLGGNPVYTAPADHDFAAKLGKVENTIHLGLHHDETARACKWHLNGTHDLEAWGDIRAYDGTASIVQPLIAPLFEGARSAIELLAMVAGTEEQGGHELVKYRWEDDVSTDDFDAWWQRALHDGIVHDSASAAVTPPAVRKGPVAAAIRAFQKIGADEWEVTFRPGAAIGDGRFSNNAWMQECPDPITKLTWDNAVLMGKRSAEKLGVDKGDVVKIEAGGKSVEGAVWIVPGIAPMSIALSTGYGRNLGESHEVASGAGFDVGPLRSSGGFDMARGVTVSKTGGTYELVSTQDHGVMEGRAHYRQADAETYKKNPTFAPEMSPLDKAAKLKDKDEKDVLKSLWTERDYSKGPQWGMVIDLNSCNGCGACVVACQSENNIPSIGKEEVGVGREMHWLRIDRYFTEENDEDLNDDAVADSNGLPMTDDPGLATQPVPCMQCENAPCESVCPVAATTHSPDGMNDMAYNRCIGTRYCANNCPYKVRRFNWFDFTKPLAEPTLQMAQNPDVTVRNRGVMEKCTYCVQRVSRAKITAKVEDRDIMDGEVVPACGQTCPSQAITFGDITDPDSAVSKARASELNYSMLSELNVKPRTTYLARVSNPHPELS